MNKERLLKLADVLEKVPPENWDLAVWVRDGRPSMGLIYGFANAVERAESCGTTACAVGWATAIWPEHFRVNEFGDGITDSSGRQNQETKIAAKFFSISVPEAKHLFDPRWYPAQNRRAIDVSARIRALVAGEWSHPDDGELVGTPQVAR